VDAGAEISEFGQPGSAAHAGRVSSFEIYALFTASGAAALTYQVLWARWLGLVFGNTATSISTVLAAFMLGLGLGSWVAGRLLPRTRDPMRVYAILELLIGLFALAFPLITAGVDAIFTAIISAESAPATRLAVRASLAFSVLVIPTTLMGATLPLLTEFFRRDPRASSTWKVGMLYATNTLGAALGTIATGFLLIELIGIRSTTLVAAGLNFLVAIIGYRYSRATVLQDPTPRGVARGQQSALAGLTLLVLACSGGVALASEVLWTRLLELLI
jgi:spermidine synthase